MRKHASRWDCTFTSYHLGRERGILLQGCFALSTFLLMLLRCIVELFAVGLNECLCDEIDMLLNIHVMNELVCE